MCGYEGVYVLRQKYFELLQTSPGDFLLHNLSCGNNLVSKLLRWASDWACVEQLGRKLQTGYLVRTALLALVG
eukprot:1147014-Pelagomonas_calceolata.AAC.1